MTKTMRKVSIAITTFVASMMLVLGSALMVKPAMADTNENFTINQGAQVRIDGTKGIRFLVDVNNEYLKNLTEEGTYEGYTASLHAAIIPTALLGGSELNATTQYVYNDANVQTLIIDLKNSDADYSTATVTRYNASLMNIPNVSYETSISARGFIKLEKDGAETAYIYTDHTAVRAMGEVATACVNDATADPAKRAAAKTMLENNLGTVSFAEESITLENGASVDVKVFGNKYGFELDEAALTANGAVITSDSANVTVDGYTITGMTAGSANITVTIGEQTDTIPVTVKDVAYKTDATGAFRWREDSTTSVVQETAGYVIKAGNGVTVNYTTELWPLIDYDVITFFVPSNGANTPEAIRVDFTDTVDATKGFSIYLYNGTLNGNPCSFVKALNRTDANPDHAVLGADTGCALGGATMALGNTGATMRLKWGRGINGVQVWNPANSSYYTIPNAKLTSDPLAFATTSNRLKLSITFYGTGANQEIGVSNICTTDLTNPIAQDATGMFSWKDDGVTAVTKTDNGYVLKGGNGTKITYTTPQWALIDYDVIT